MAWIRMSTGTSAALDDDPEFNFAGFCSANAVMASLAKHVSELEAEDLVEGASGHNPPWTDTVLIASWMDYGWDLGYEELEEQIV
ncbi:MAG: hypothetical protein ABR884_00030 [Minisyncoccia bacterium]|jgi:hypothetical protein